MSGMYLLVMVRIDCSVEDSDCVLFCGDHEAAEQ